jgi:tetratricopeptide (TPR) repeat protein
MKRLIIILFNIAVIQLAAQEADIKKALIEIEAGNIQAAQTYLQEFKNSSPDDPSVIFLDAVLTQNADEAVIKYSTLYEKYPRSNYADASLYRLFSYYYSLGYYKKAETYLDKLKAEYPASPYIKTADRTIPDEEESEIRNDTEPEKSINYKYTIQAGAFLNSDNAKKLASQLSGEGLESQIKIREIGGSMFNIVYTGKFENEDAAKPVLDLLDKSYSIKARVVLLSSIE